MAPDQSAILDFHMALGSTAHPTHGDHNIFLHNITWMPCR